MALGIQGNKGRGHVADLTAFLFFHHFHDIYLSVTTALCDKTTNTDLWPSIHVGKLAAQS